MEWYLKVIKNYVGFEGRARRTEYWMFVLFNIIIGFAIGIVELLLNMPDVLTILYGLFIFLPSLAVTVRRLHDTGRSGWWILISFIPIIGFFILLVFTILDSEPGDNRFGSNPKESGSY